MSSDESDYEEGQQVPEVEDASIDDSDDNLIDQDDSDDDDELKVTAWGKKKNQFYNEEEGKHVPNNLTHHPTHIFSFAHLE